MRQISFFKKNDFPTEFGGELLKGKRKTKRPLNTKKALHNVLRADFRKNFTSFLKHRGQISSVLQEYSRRFNVKIYRQGLARDHLHLMVKVSRREDYVNFVRVVSGVLAKLFKFRWLYRPYTRIVEWGRDFKQACAYVVQNELEGLGLIPYKERRGPKRLKVFSYEPYLSSFLSIFCTCM